MKREFSFILSTSTPNREGVITYLGDDTTLTVTDADGVASGTLSLYRKGANETAAFTAAGSVDGTTITFDVPTSERNDFLARIVLEDAEGSRITVYDGFVSVI